MPRQRKSLSLHELQGTTARYTADDTPTFRAGRPKMPADLSEVEAAEWKRLVRELKKRNTLTSADSSSLELYVRQFGRWKLCLADIATRGPVIESAWVDSQGKSHTKVIENPSSKLCTRLEASLRQLLVEFSATPLSRDKTKPAARPAAKPTGPDPNSEEGLLLQLAELHASEPDAESEPEQPDFSDIGDLAERPIQ
jgi:P27 family predicted phage terminase small subunit